MQRSRGTNDLGHLAYIAQLTIDRGMREGVQVELVLRAGKLRALRLRPLQPGLLPDELATGLTSTMALAIASQGFQQHCIAHPAQAAAVGILVHLLDAPLHRKAVLAVDHHLGHERQPFQATALIECREDLRQAAHLYQLAGPQARARIQEPAQCRSRGTGDPFARANGKIGQSAFFTGIPIQDDDTTDGDERDQCTCRR